MKKACALFVFIFLVSWPGTARAYTLILITEIMYDVPGTDTGREWIEVYNSGTTSIDFSSWRLGEGETNHKIKEGKGDKILSPGAYAVIADNLEKFLADYSGYAGVVFESSFSLSNDGETLALKDSTLNALHEITYLKDVGAAGDGNSLQKIDGVWHVAMPTPGEENSMTAALSITHQFVPIAEGSIIVAGELLEGETIAFDLEPAVDGKVVWNFGDGTTATTDGSTAEYAYAFAGIYSVVAEHTAGIVQTRVSIDAKPTLEETIDIAKKANQPSEVQVTTSEIHAEEKEHESIKKEISSETLVAASVSANAPIYPWLLGLGGLAVLAVLAVRIIRRQEPSPVVVVDDGIELID